MSKIKDFFQNHRKLCLVLLAILLFVGGYGTAVTTRAAKVVTKVVAKTDVQTVVKYQDRVVVKEVRVAAKQEHRHVETTTTKKPDGTVVTATKTDVDTNTNTNQQTGVDARSAGSTVQTVVKTVYKEKTVTSQPNWAVHAGVGYALPALFGQQQIGVPGMDGFVVQAGLDRRVAGPFWLGVFGSTQGTVGLSLRVAW